MANLDRIRVSWRNAPGGPGVSTFYAIDGAAATVALALFYEAVKAFVVAPIVWDFPSAGDTINEATGELVGGWTGATIASITATGATTNMANAVGWVVNWNTADIFNGHRIRGRTFFVPCPSAALSGGTLNDTIIPDIEDAAQVMIDAVPENLVVWSRPFAGTPAWTDVRGVVHPAKGARDGGHGVVTAGRVPDMGAVLTSRRD